MTAADQLPALLPVVPEGIPAALKAHRRWAPWRAVWDDKRGKYDKIPASGLSTKQPDRWHTLDAALTAQQRSGLAGLGYCMTGPHGVVGIDLDGCVQSDGSIAPWAAEVVAAMASYTELSPSSRGLRIMVLGEVPEDWTNHARGIEVYAGHSARFLTLTGQQLPGTPADLQTPPQGALDALRARFGRPAAAVAPTGTPMPELVDELALPDVASLNLPHQVVEFLTTGSRPGDRSSALHSAGIALYAAGLNDAQVFSMLVYNEHAMQAALEKRLQDTDKALQYLWVEQCTKAKPKAAQRVATADDFPDVSGEAAAAKAGHPWAEFLELRATPQAPRFVIPWFIQEGVVVIAGAPGVGKTTTLLPLALTAAGLHREGDPLAPDHWRHICYLTEAPEQVEQLLAAAARCPERAVSFEQIAERVHVAPLHRLAPAEAVKAGSVFAANFTRRVGEEIIPPLVVIDTQAAALALENENANSEVSAAVAAFKQRFAGLPVWFVSHTAKAQWENSDTKALTARGGGAWGGDAHQLLFVVEDCGRAYLRRSKTRFEARWPELEVTTEVVNVPMLHADGTAVEHPVRWASLVPVGAAQGAADRKDDTLRIALGLVAQEHEAGNPVSTTTSGPGNTGQRLRALAKTLERMSSSAVHALLVEAEARGLLKQEPRQSAGKRNGTAWALTDAGRTWLETL